MRRCVECHNILNLNEVIACDACKKAILDQLEEQWQEGEIVHPPSMPVESKLNTNKVTKKKRKRVNGAFRWYRRYLKSNRHKRNKRYSSLP